VTQLTNDISGSVISNTFTVNRLAVTMANRGLVSSRSGTLDLGTGFAQTAGTTELSGGDLAGTARIAGGLLTGNGTISGAAIVSGTGCVAPGDGGVGSMTASSANLSGAGELHIKIPDNLNADRLNTAGNLTLAVTSQLVLDLAGYTRALPGAVFTVAHADGALSGTFSGVTALNNTSGKPVMIGYTTQDVNIGVGVVPAGATTPTVVSIVRAGTDPTKAGSVGFTVTFSEAVTGVDSSDFVLTTTGTMQGASVTAVTGGPSVYAVAVNTGTGDGTCRLDVKDDDTITNSGFVPLGGPGAGNGSFTSGEAYTVDKTPPVLTLSGLSQVYDGLLHEAVISSDTLPVAVTYSGSTAPPTNPGDYAVVATATNAVGDVGMVSGVLTINKAPAAVALSSLSQTYDGTAKSATATTTPGGLAVNLTYDGSAVAPSAAGTYSVMATVDDANYQASAAGVLVINAPPHVESAPTANPNTARVSETVSFFVAATDADGGALTCTWDFGDGSSATGASVTHAYAVVGTYTATVTINDGKGGLSGASVAVTVTPAGGDMQGDADSDGDGFSDQIETALGSSPTNANDRPAALAVAEKTGVLSVRKLRIRLNFARPANDSIALNGLLAIPDGFGAAGQTVIVDVGGVVRSVTLDAKGRSPKGNDSVAVGVKSGKAGTPLQVAKFAVKLMKGSFAAALQDDGLVNATATAQVTVPVTVIFNGEVLKKAVTQAYKATKDKAGATK
jgi:hypothetical protein